MGEYLYGVKSFLYKVDGIEKTKIVKETQKQFRVKIGIDAYGHSHRIPKDHSMIAFSVNEALDKYVKEQYKKIETLQRTVAELYTSIDSTKKFRE